MSYLVLGVFVCVSLAVFLSMLLMAFVWGLWALLAIVRHERILHRCATSEYS
jgi:hypothetical protein